LFGDWRDFGEALFDQLDLLRRRPILGMSPSSIARRNFERRGWPGEK